MSAVKKTSKPMASDPTQNISGSANENKERDWKTKCFEWAVERVKSKSVDRGLKDQISKEQFSKGRSSTIAPLSLKIEELFEASNKKEPRESTVEKLNREWVTGLSKGEFKTPKDLARAWLKVHKIASSGRQKQWEERLLVASIKQSLLDNPDQGGLIAGATFQFLEIFVSQLKSDWYDLNNSDHGDFYREFMPFGKNIFSDFGLGEETWSEKKIKMGLSELDSQWVAAWKNYLQSPGSKMDLQDLVCFCLTIDGGENFLPMPMYFLNQLLSEQEWFDFGKSLHAQGSKNKNIFDTFIAPLNEKICGRGDQWFKKAYVLMCGGLIEGDLGEPKPEVNWFHHMNIEDFKEILLELKKESSVWPRLERKLLQDWRLPEKGFLEDGWGEAKFSKASKKAIHFLQSVWLLERPEWIQILLNHETEGPLFRASLKAVAEDVLSENKNVALYLQYLLKNNSKLSSALSKALLSMGSEKEILTLKKETKPSKKNTPLKAGASKSTTPKNVVSKTKNVKALVKEVEVNVPMVLIKHLFFPLGKEEHLIKKCVTPVHALLAHVTTFRSRFLEKLPNSTKTLFEACEAVASPKELSKAKQSFLIKSLQEVASPSVEKPLKRKRL